MAVQESRGAVFHHDGLSLANGYVPEMNRIRAAYEKRGVSFYAVQVDNTVSEAEVRKYAQEFGYSFPMLNDPRLILARLTGAKVTPEVAILWPAGEVLYLGRVDNKVEDLTHPRYAATDPELRNALDAVLAGKVPKKREPSGGLFDQPGKSVKFHSHPHLRVHRPVRDPGAAPTFNKDIAPILYENARPAIGRAKWLRFRC